MLRDGALVGPWRTWPARARWFVPVLLFLAAGAGGSVLLLVAVKISPLVSLGAVLGGLLFLVLVRQPYLGLLATAAVIPLERMGRFTDDTTMQTISVMRVVGVVALGALLIHGMIRRQRFAFGPAFVLYALYAAFTALTITYTGDLLGTVRAAGTICGNLMFFFVVVNLARDRALADKAILVWLAATVVLGMYSVYDWHLGSGARGGVHTGEIDPGRGVQQTENRWSTVWEDRAEWESLGGRSLRRSMGPTSHAAVWGINLILTVPFYFYLARFARRREVRWFVWAGLPIVLYNVFLTNTRAVILLAAGTLALCAARGLFRLNRSMVLGGIAVVGVLLLAAPADIYNRVLALSNYTPEQSAALRIRLAYWDAGLRIIQDHWATGIGVGNEQIVPEYVQVQAPDATTVHNEYLQTFMEVGVVGGLVFFSFVGLLLVYAFKAAEAFRRSDREQAYWLMVACQIAMIAVLIFGLQVDVFHFPLKGWWLVAGITAVMYANRTAAAPAVSIAADRGAVP